MTTIETEWYDCDTMPVRDGAYEVRTVFRDDPEEFVLVEIFLDGTWWHPHECEPCGLSPEMSWRGLATEQPLSTRAELALHIVSRVASLCGVPPTPSAQAPVTTSESTSVFEAYPDDNEATH